MGCSASKLDDEEAVQLCKDRKNFIKQVIEHRNRFASGHVAYIQSMRRVSLALLHYVMAEDLHGFLSDSYTTPPFTPVKGLSPEIRAPPLKFFTPTSNETVKSGVRTVNYLRSGGNQSVAIEEWPEPHQTVQLESYYPMENYGVNGFFAAQSSPVYRSSFFSSPPYNRARYQSSSPQASRWDYFWNPFSSLDQYGYTSRSSFDRIVNDDDIAGLRQVREAEGIPELEEDIDDDDRDCDHDRAKAVFWKAEAKSKSPEVEFKHTGVQVGDESPVSGSVEVQKVQEVKEMKSKRSHTIEASEDQNAEKAVEVEVPNRRQVAGTGNAEETPGFTVYVNRRPASMAEVMKDMENQFVRICDCAHEISLMLETSRAQYSSSNELAAVRMLNPIALFRSSSSHSSASKFLHTSSSSRGDADESSSDYSEECCMLSGSHKSTIDRLYAWEKKLYEEVKSGERVRIAYEKKCMQLRNHDINGDEPSAVDKTRAAIRDLHTRLKISIQTVESISKRIEVLRDGELHPQLLEMIQGLRRMWKTMADCHLIQKRTIDEAKLLLFSNNATAAAAAAAAAITPPKQPRPAANLAAELRNWRSSFANWIDAQRSYTRALASWASRCAPADAGETSGSRKALSPFSPLRVGGEGDAACPEVVRVCVRWLRLVESVSEEMAVDGMDFFAAGMASVSAQQREAEDGALAAAAQAAEELGPRVLCAGLSVAVGSLAELAVVSAEGYDAVVSRCVGGGQGGGVADA